MRFSDTCLSLSKAFCCCPVGLMISSMRCTGSLVKLAAWSPQSEANVVASEELVPAVPRPYSVSFAPSASKRCLWSSFSELYKCGSAGRTISMACIVARGAFQWRLAARALLDKISPHTRVTPRLIRFRHFCSGSLALASLDRACRNLGPAFPQRSPLWLSQHDLTLNGFISPWPLPRRGAFI